MATIMAVPIAILVAIYIAEYAGPKAASFFRVMLDVLNGVPAILVGIFIYGLLVVGHGQSAIYGAMALAILMIPMVARATQEVLELVPRHLREASLALGVPRWRTVYSIVLPTAIGGMLTGIVIAVARVAGETAPLIFTSSIVTSQGVSVDVHEALATLPVRIFTLSESPSPGRPGGRLGRRARADRVRARDEHPRQVLRGRGSARASKASSAGLRSNHASGAQVRRERGLGAVGLDLETKCSHLVVQLVEIVLTTMFSPYVRCRHGERMHPFRGIRSSAGGCDVEIRTDHRPVVRWGVAHEG